MNLQRYQLDDLVQARPVAVVGASQDPTRIGGRPIAFLKDAGFAGAIYPVNAKYPEVHEYMKDVAFDSRSRDA